MPTKPLPTTDLRLVIADVDGTLVTPQKVLTDRAQRAVGGLHAAGIVFTITSGRPPRGMKKLIDELHITAPIAAFNGGALVNPDLSVVTAKYLRPDDAEAVINRVSHCGLDVWLYTENEWFVRDPKAAHVAREQWTVGFAPTVAASFAPLLSRAMKIVGISDEYQRVERCEADLQQQAGGRYSATRSQPYYLDITHPDANKGQVVLTLSKLLNIPAENIATIGDMPNDVLMFRQSGYSIAMGNASDAVQAAAKFVTTSNEQEGFANAMERLILHQRARSA